MIPPLGTPLNAEQWEMVKRLRPSVDHWNAHELVDSAAMGRSAAKVESLDEVLDELSQAGFSVRSGLRQYGNKAVRSLGATPGKCSNSSQVVGYMTATPAPAKAVEPHRLKFWGVPTFDPRPFMDANASVFEFPLQHACHPDELHEKPPAVRVRVSARDRIAFLEALDKTDRLALRPTAMIREGLRSGVFAIPKDAERDRMVLDARPGNCCEERS